MLYILLYQDTLIIKYSKCLENKRYQLVYFLSLRYCWSKLFELNIAKYGLFLYRPTLKLIKNLFLVIINGLFSFCDPYWSHVCINSDTFFVPVQTLIRAEALCKSPASLSYVLFFVILSVLLPNQFVFPFFLIHSFYLRVIYML